MSYSNGFDDFRPDVQRLFDEQTATLPLSTGGDDSGTGVDPLWGLRARARLYGNGLLLKTGMHERLVHANLRLDWFREFHAYWTDALGNRPLNPHEFHFLHGVYRQRVGRPAGNLDTFPHRQGWLDPRSVYQLFHHQYRLALNPLQARRFAHLIPRGGAVCEYGCGLAPITTGLIRYYRHLRLRLACADVPNLLFHFTRWRFRAYPFVRTLVIEPESKPPIDEPYDVIVSLQALKYILNPVAVIEHLDRFVKPGGHLVFDYARPDVRDDDPRVRDRMEALRYIAERYRVIDGDIPLDGRTVPLTVARKL
jgi:hypothetical protein